MYSVTVIVPVYNVGRYLEKTLASLAAQSLKGIHFLIIDDGSTDDSKNIIDSWVSTDSRFESFHRENQGYGCAVNFGLNKATDSEYVAILESDDWVEPSFYEDLYSYAKKYNCEICRCGFSEYSQFREKDIIWKETLDFINNAPRGCFAPIEYPSIFSVHSALWTYIYQADFIRNNNIKFCSERKSYSDVPFIFEVLTKTHSVGIVKKFLHHYRMEANQGSTSTTKNKRALDIQYMCELSKDIVLQYDKYKQIETRFYNHCIKAQRYFYYFTPDELKDRFLSCAHDFFINYWITDSISLEPEDFSWFSKVKSYSIQEQPTDIAVCRQDLFNDDSIHIGFSFDKNYSEIFGVCLQTLVKHTNPNRKYVCHIMAPNITYIDYGLFHSIIDGHNNIKLHLLRVDNVEVAVDKLFVDRHITKTCYFRFFLPELLPQIKKILYVDVDLIFCDDAAKCFDFNIGQHLIAGCQDKAVAHLNFGDFEKSHTLLKRLGYSDIHNYVNSGVLLMNLDEMRKCNLTKSMLKLASTYQFPFHDQDVINLACEGRIVHLDDRWNVTTHTALWLYPSNIQQEFKERMQEWNFGIIHYPGAAKPWNSDQGILPKVWINESKNCVFFAELSTASHNDNELSIAHKRYSSVYLTYLRYKLMSMITIGNRKYRYKNKRDIYHDCVRKYRMQHNNS